MPALKIQNIGPQMLAKRSNAMCDIRIRPTSNGIHGYPKVTYFSKFGLVEDVSPIISKAGIANGDLVLQVTVDRKLTWTFRHTLMLVIVEGQRPHC